MHFGHDQILRYCKRPFGNVDEMDNELIRRWNEVVQPSDTVYHLGDFSMGRVPESFVPVGSHSVTEKAFIESMASRLNGTKIFVKGDHREPPITVDNAKVTYEGYNFVMVHEPQKAAEAGFWFNKKTCYCTVTNIITNRNNSRSLIGKSIGSMSVWN